MATTHPSIPGTMPGATPTSEKSVYYDAGAGGDANPGGGGGDVSRKPTVTTGAIESRESDTKTAGNVRDSGYAQGTVSDAKTKASASTASAHDPSPAYVEGDSKTATGRPGQSAPQGTEANRHVTGAFASGAALTGPDALPDENPAQHERAATAESQLSDEGKKKINKAEQKDAKRLAKVIKSEGKAQESNLNAFLKELSKLQAVQKQASKDETKALSAHNKATENAHNAHSKFLKAKAEYEHAEADARARKDAMEAARKRAQETTTELANKSREAEELRRVKMVDDREREARIQQLSQAGN